MRYSLLEPVSSTYQHPYCLQRCSVSNVGAHTLTENVDCSKLKQALAPLPLERMAESTGSLSGNKTFHESCIVFVIAFFNANLNDISEVDCILKYTDFLADE